MHTAKGYKIFLTIFQQEFCENLRGFDLRFKGKNKEFPCSKYRVFAFVVPIKMRVLYKKPKCSVSEQNCFRHTATTRLSQSKQYATHSCNIYEWNKHCIIVAFENADNSSVN